MKKDLLWNLFLITSIILIVHGMSHTGDADKKTAQAAQGETALGAGGVVTFAFKKQFLQTLAIMSPLGLLVGLGAAAFIFLGPFAIGQWRNVFSPQTVPTWVWFVGFGLLFIMLVKKK